MTIFHRALEEHPRYLAQMEVVAEVQDRSDKVRDQAIERQREVDQAARDHQAAIAEAVANGTPVPSTPPAPAAADSLQHAVYLIRSEQAAAQADTERLVAEIAGDVLTRLGKAVAADMKSVADHAQAVEAARQRVELALRTASTVRRAVENGQVEVPRPSPADRTRSHMNTDELLDLARAAADPLALLPIGFRENRILGVGPEDHGDLAPRAHAAALEESLPTAARDELRRRRDLAGRF